MGIATFLLQMVQLQAAALGANIDLYLQSNISSDAYSWYTNCGFILTTSNTAEHLPKGLKDYYDSSQKTPIKTPYVHFVTTEIWNSDITKMKTHKMGNDP